MRLEGKNSQIKKLVGKIFKNLPKTVAERHQRYMCSQLLSAPGTSFANYLIYIYSGDSICVRVHSTLYVHVDSCVNNYLCSCLIFLVETQSVESVHPVGIRTALAKTFLHDAHLPL